jgi:hypothetical protein
MLDEPGLTWDKPDGFRRAPNGSSTSGECSMRLLTELMTTDVGLMSAAGILFMLGMAVFFLRYFLKHMREDEARAAQHKP